MDDGGISMADIFDFVKESYNRRPLYTSYELSKKVRDKREESKKGLLEFASLYEISVEDLKKIEEGKCSFSPKLYRICGNILNLSSDELLKETVDDISVANFRADDKGEAVKDTFDIANMLFHEIIMQEKIAIN